MWVIKEKCYILHFHYAYYLHVHMKDKSMGKIDGKLFSLDKGKEKVFLLSKAVQYIRNLFI